MTKIDAYRKVIWSCNSNFKIDIKCTTPHLDAELDSLNEKITVVAELVKTCVRKNAFTAQWQEEYAKKYKGLLAHYEKATVNTPSKSERPYR